MKKSAGNQKFQDDRNGMSRRHFVKLTGISAVGLSSLGYYNFKIKAVSIVSDPADLIAGSPPSLWALKELEEILTSRGINIHKCSRLSEARNGDLIIISAGSDASIANQLLKKANVEVPAVAEALGLVPVNSDNKQMLLACGHDVRGLVYAFLELADIVQNSDQPFDSLNIQKPVIEQPANVIRSINRLFVSDIEDKPWYYDREMWTQYLTMITAQRFNRFNLGLGIGYDFLQNVTDAYFLFAYPFFFRLPVPVICSGLQCSGATVARC